MLPWCAGHKGWPTCHQALLLLRQHVLRGVAKLVEQGLHLAADVSVASGGQHVESNRRQIKVKLPKYELVRSSHARGSLQAMEVQA